MAAQQPDIKRTDLQQQDLSAPGREVVQACVDLGPTAPLVKSGPAGGRHRGGSFQPRLAGLPPHQVARLIVAAARSALGASRRKAQASVDTTPGRPQ